MKVTTYISFALALLLCPTSKAGDKEYGFEALNEALEETTGEPFQSTTMEGIKIRSYMYSGSFDTISEKARVLIKEMGIDEMTAEEKALSDEAFDSAMGHFDESNMKVKGHLMYNLDAGSMLTLTLVETAGMNMLMVQEVNPSEVTSGAGHSVGAEPGDVSPEEKDRGMRIAQGDLSVATNEVERFYALNYAAKNALDSGDVEKAEALATELARLAPKYKDDWNYGNAIEDSNQVLGRVALMNGDVAEAKKRLLASADSKGSPQMNSFGPNMELAKALLEKGEREVVLEYFERCGVFWEMGEDRLAAWTSAVKEGEIPKFGGNLKY